MSKICNKCGKENPENLTFCENCGSLLLNAQESKKDSKKEIKRESFVLKDDFERIFRDYLPQRERIGTVAAPIAYFIKEDVLADFSYLIDGQVPCTGTSATVGVGNLAHCPQLFFWGDYGCNLELMHEIFRQIGFRRKP